MSDVAEKLHKMKISRMRRARNPAGKLIFPLKVSGRTITQFLLFLGPTVPKNQHGRVKTAREILRAFGDWLDGRYCDICHRRLVRYGDGTMECLNLRKEVQIQKGGIVKHARKP